MRKYHKYFPDGENRIGCRVSFLDHVGQLAVGFADVLSPGGGLVLPVDDFGLRHCFGPSDEPEKTGHTATYIDTQYQRPS